MDGYILSGWRLGVRNSEKVRKMPCYPNEGSIMVDGDTVIVKMSNDY